MTTDEAKKLLDEIEKSGGLTDNMREGIRRLKDDYDEREGMLKKEGETRDGEGREEESPEEQKREDDKFEELSRRIDDVSKRFTDFMGKYKDRVLNERKALDEHRRDYEAGDFEEKRDFKKEDIFKEVEVVK